MIQYTHYDGSYYCINAYHDMVKDNDFLTIDRCRNGIWKTHCLKVSDTKQDYVFKIQKTKIISRHGISALYKHLEECISNNFAIDAWFISPINASIDTTKKYNHSDYFKPYDFENVCRNNCKEEL